MEEKSLRELVEMYFRKRHYQIDFDFKIDKHRKFDIIITEKEKSAKLGKTIGVLICDIHRSIGLNVLRKIEGMVEDSDEISDGILVGKDFSSQVRKFSKSYDIKLLSRSEIRRNLESLWDY